MLGLLTRAVERLGRDGPVETWRYARHWLSERYHERRLGIDSLGAIRRTRLGIADPNPDW